MLKKLDYEGYITLSTRFRKLMCEELGIKDQTLRNRIGLLLKTKIKDSLANAFEDVKTTTAATDYHDFGLALSFIVPYYLNEKNVEDTEIELDNVLSDLDCSFYVSFKTTTEDIINENDGVYNSVILVGKFA